MRKHIDLTGKKFGEWTVIDLETRLENGKSYWNCICSCGFKRVLRSDNLTLNVSKMCWDCYNAKRSGIYATPGTIVGKWTVLGRDKKKDKHSLCKCSCGQISSVGRSSLRVGTSTSCINCSDGINHEEMLGRLFYRWTVIEIVRTTVRHGGAGVKYKCRCKCGSERLIHRSELINLKSSQCRLCQYNKA